MASADMGLLLVALFSFVTAALVADGLFTLWQWRRASASNRALSAADPLNASLKGPGLPAVPSVLRARPLSQVPWLDRQLFRIRGIDRVETLLRQAGMSWTVGRLFGSAAISLLTVALGLAAFMALRPDLAAKLSWLALVLLPTAAVWPIALAARRRERRLQAFDEQLPDALDTLSRALRAGYSTMGALKVVGEEMPEPLGPEFSQTHDEISFGTSPQLALNHLVARMPSESLRYMVIAMLVQRETGGNLSEVLDKIARLMRERIKLALQVRTLSADGRFSAVVLCLLPFVTVGLVALINRGYIEQLWTTAGGMKILTACALMMLTGIVWIRRIVQIRF